MFTFEDLLYGIPLLFGVLLVLGNALGVFGLEVDADAGSADLEAGHELALADADADVEAGEDVGLLEALGVGRVPMAVLLMSLTLLFGGVGTMLLPLARSAFGSTSAAWITFALASFASLLGTRSFARLFARLLPSVESYASTKADLLGLVGRVVVCLDTQRAVVSVLDPGGAELRVTAFVDPEAPRAGECVELVAYDSETRLYLAKTADPS